MAVFPNTGSGRHFAKLVDLRSVTSGYFGLLRVTSGYFGLLLQNPRNRATWTWSNFHRTRQTRDCIGLHIRGENLHVMENARHRLLVAHDENMADLLATEGEIGKVHLLFLVVVHALSHSAVEVIL